MHIPSPSLSVLHLGPLSVHLYALCILLGISVAVWLTRVRYYATGGDPQLVTDLATVAVPAGIVGGRMYHVATSWEQYFGPGGNPWSSLAVWKGGLGIWGAVALGAGAVWFRTRHMVKQGLMPAGQFAVLADAAAPGVAFAQAIGRWGNWFNVELFGRPLDTFWALEVPAQYRPAGYQSFASFHPTFLYESLWCVAVGFILLGLSRRRPQQPGVMFSLYVALYSVGRGVIETLRIDDAHHLFGIRLNVWTAVVVALFGGVSALVLARQRADRAEGVDRTGSVA